MQSPSPDLIGSRAPASNAPARNEAVRGLIALLLGAVAIGFAPIFVRLSEAGPSATAFWRLALALPALGTWALLERREATPKPRTAAGWGWIAIAGLCFAGDLAVWHWSIHFTSIANATLFANFASILVVLFSWLFLREVITSRFILAMVIALGGTVLLVSANLHFSRQTFVGDLLGLCTAVFYAGYLLSVKLLRGKFPTAVIMAGTAAVSAPTVGLVAILSHERFFPVTSRGWLLMLGLALISHAAGQSLIAYALAHLRASFSSVALLLQPVVAGAAAWTMLGERLTPWQVVGGCAVMCGVALARMQQPQPRESGATPSN